MKNKCICGHYRNWHEQGIGKCHDDNYSLGCNCQFYVEEDWEEKIENEVNDIRYNEAN